MINFNFLDKCICADNFYEVLGHAFVYKMAEDVKIEDMTIAMIEKTYPTKLMKYLREQGI